jgi:hypothetical protein
MSVNLGVPSSSQAFQSFSHKYIRSPLHVTVSILPAIAYEADAMRATDFFF